MITADVQQLEPGGRVTVFELDASSVGADQLWFHQHLQAGVIWWQGQQYGAWPIEATGFAETSDQQPAPHLKVGNGDGRIGVMCQLYGDLVGARIIRRQTLVKYLDGKNFPPLKNRLVNSGLGLRTSDANPPTGWLWGGNTPGTARSYVPSGLPGSGTAVRMSGAASAVNQYLELRTPDRVVPVEPGQPFVGSAYFRGSAGQPSIIIWFLDSTGATIGSAQQNSFAMPAEFERKSTAARTAPPNAASARVYFRVQSTAAGQAIQMDVTNVQFEQGTVATEYQFTGADLDAGRNPTADPNEHFPDEIWFIERKVAETKEMVEFELATAIDLNGEVLPGRQIMSNVCTWLLRGGYRGPYCSYTGSAYFDINDNPVSDPGQDVCAGLVRSCKRRFGDNNEIPYGGFPAAGLVRT